MTYEIRLTAEQLRQAALWAEPGVNMADVEIRVEGDVVVVSQGDDEVEIGTVLLDSRRVRP